MFYETLAEVIFSYDRFTIGCRNNFRKITREDFELLITKAIPPFKDRCLVISLDLATIHHEDIINRIHNGFPIPMISSLNVENFTLFLFSDYGESLMKTIRKKVENKLTRDIEAHHIIENVR